MIDLPEGEEWPETPADTLRPSCIGVLSDLADIPCFLAAFQEAVGYEALVRRIGNGGVWVYINDTQDSGLPKAFLHGWASARAIKEAAADAPPL